MTPAGARERRRYSAQRRGRPASHSAGNPYLEGNFAPVDVETTITNLDVRGTIPGYLDGCYVRNGPNPIRAHPGSYHWFIGDGMVHGVRLREGRAEWYRNRWVRSRDVARALREPAPSRPTHAGLDYAPNTHVIAHGGRVLALVEAGPRPYELTADLETVGPYDFNGTLPRGFTAHPKRDPRTGELHAVTYYWGRPSVQYLTVSADARVTRVVDIDVPGSPMMHDFALTERYVIVLDLPVVFDTSQVAKLAPWPASTVARAALPRIIGRHAVPKRVAARVASRGKSLFPYAWDVEREARVGVIPRDDPLKTPTWLTVAPCMVFHVVNAYEAGGRIVLDVVRHPRAFDQQRHGPNEGATRMSRWTVDLDADSVQEDCIDDQPTGVPANRRSQDGTAVSLRILRRARRP